MAKIDNSADEVCTDEISLRDKRKVMNKQWWNSIFYSTSDTFKFLAAVVLSAGMGVVGMAIKDAAIAGTASSFSGVMAAIGASPVGLAFLGVAAVCTAVAIGSQFMSSRYFHSGNFDALELNAQHTAKYLIKEIKKQTPTPAIEEHEQNCRADGKQWSQVVKASDPSAAQAPVRG